MKPRRRSKDSGVPAMRPVVLLLVAAVALVSAHSGEGEEPPAPPADASPAPSKDPIVDDYRGYVPDFVEQIKAGDRYRGPFRGWRRNKEQMKLSSEPGFYTQVMLDLDSRANALVEAGIKKEQMGNYREALKVYRQLFERILKQQRNLLYRVSESGVYVPVSQYVQRRILNFPKEDLEFYRMMMDPEAREAFQTARRKYSLEGFSEVVDLLLPTSYGDNALFELGNAELDSGHYLAALDYFATLHDFFPDSDCRTSELAVKIAYCRKMLGMPAQKAEAEAGGVQSDPETLARLKRIVEDATAPTAGTIRQRANAPHESVDDYAEHPAPGDVLATGAPQWTVGLPASWRDNWVYAQPVVTEHSVLYRHKNVLYCRSLLTGELRWKNDLGGRATWQNRNERLYPLEDILVQNGMVFTPMHKIGPSLVALDEVTGSLQWAFGPMAASSEEEARMRFESAPAWGPQTVFATYILDNIEGVTHTDTEYGVIAFEAQTGRVKWRVGLCRLPPGVFSTGNKGLRRNRIRSFSTPPLYHQGRVYVATNAGTVAVLDAFSGRIQWLMSYPYNPAVHDATTEYGQTYSGVFTDRSWWPHDPMFWFGQRPLVVGDRLFVAPVDSKFFLCLDRRSGKVLWSRPKESAGFTWFLGAISTGELVFATSGRSVELWDPATGRTTWKTDDLVEEVTEPLLKHVIPFDILDLRRPHGIFLNDRYFGIGARPFLVEGDRLCVTSWTDIGIYYTVAEGWWPDLCAYNLAWVDLKERKVLDRRRYLSGRLQVFCRYYQHDYGPRMIKSMEQVPGKSGQLDEKIRILKEVVEDAKPVNAHGPFRPFERLTFTRYGVPFELRFGPQEVSMAYDIDGLRRRLEGATGPEADFARAELAAAQGRLSEAAQLFEQCLANISSEDLDFRARVNQQLYLVHKNLTRIAIRTGDKERELKHALGMSRTAGTMGDEVETLFTLAEAYERRGEWDSAARILRSIVSRYGRDPYSIASVAGDRPDEIVADCRGAIDAFGSAVANDFFRRELEGSLGILKQGLPIYFSALSPLAKDYTVRAGELAAARLARIQREHEDFRKAFESQASAALKDRPAQEQTYRLWEFPGTAASQEVLHALFKANASNEEPGAERRLWELADLARIGGLSVPEAQRASVLAPDDGPPEPALLPGAQERRETLVSDDAVDWLALPRNGGRAIRPELFFFGGRVKKRLACYFAVQCMDLASGKVLWTARDLRLKGKGEEPGFFEAHVHGSLVVVHGLYDVFAFGLEDGARKWQYRVPFDFEIKHVAESGDLLVLAGAAESVALHAPSGEVAWQKKEHGDLYLPPYFDGDRYVTVRQYPDNVTVRYRATGTLIGRLDLPELSRNQDHPLLADGPPALPAAHCGRFLALTEGEYYWLFDTRTLRVLWKRPIDARGSGEAPPMRFALSDKALFVTKRDYDQKAVYALSIESGEVLWTSSKANETEEQAAAGDDPNRARALHSVFIEDGVLYGIEPHEGNGFYFVARNAADGKLLFRREAAGYAQAPEVHLLPKAFGGYAVVAVRDNQDYELRAYERKTGEPAGVLKKKGTGEFGVHGRVSFGAQDGHLILLSKYDLSIR